MRLILLSFVGLLLLTQCQQQGATISFEIKANAEAPLLMGKLVEESYKVDTFFADANNIIKIELASNELKDVRFNYEKNTLSPFINDGDRLQVTITQGENGLDIVYAGDNAMANNYKLERERSINYELIQKIYANDKEIKSFVDMAAEIDQIQAVWMDRLHNLKGVSEKFMSDEENYLKYYFYYIKGVYPWYMNRHTGKAIDADSDYNAFIAGLEEDTAHEAVEMYYQVFDQKVRFALNVEKSKKDLGDTAYIVELNTIAQQIKSKTLKNKMLSNSISGYLSWSINGLLDETYVTYQNLCTDEAMKKRVEVLYTNAIKLMPGQPAPDFDMYTADGEKVMLSDFKGKYVYFDVWATWCGPCKMEIPYLAKVVEALEGNTNVEVISISVDSDHEAWKKMIEEDQPQWKQFIVNDAFNSSLAKQYNISGIPQFTLIDPEGKIIDVQALRPSHPDLLTLLKSY
ncbi:TlpA family protein disulfide reductase [Carboxylicivirga mesophila]|uniref:TlpA family protein disulfide reductase n=1 Tax=Carboxylicivirga mesophila TaxID=1166478 RepID=A0ABS5KDP6_9BACT|nr:TlpA disulfide reductase family protein [Carboxylicivirga mesophila]MBS2212641.1 TlpA family protein disulfide reductase [Carboxylicivirga mesophila]